eukprot:COSAG05_NODE_7807_length_767_cov_1.232036_2_plen_48_part_01
MVRSENGEVLEVEKCAAPNGVQMPSWNIHVRTHVRMYATCNIGAWDRE